MLIQPQKHQFKLLLLAMAVALSLAAYDDDNNASIDNKTLTHSLTGWAALPAAARTVGPTSGQFIKPANDVVPPFVNEQPIPGWSGLLNNGNGSFLAMPDNGYGAKSNSGDYLIGYYTITPTFKTTGDGTTNPGSITNNKFLAFNDLKGFLNNGIGVDLQITADFDNYQNITDGALVDSGIAVDNTIKNDRLLTGFDFDVESVARSGDGSLWVGEEFGPYLLQFDEQTGTLMRDPIPHPTLKSPFNPDVLAGNATATLGSSRGFESLAFNATKTLLYVVPESAPLDTARQPVPGDERVLEIFEFNPATASYTGNNFKYRKEGSETQNKVVIGEMTNIADNKFILIERDSKFGVNAEIKHLYLIDLNVTDAEGILVKRLILDLLDINDPQDIGGDILGLDKHKFNLPFDSIENVVVINETTLGIAIDTNYPYENGRTCTTAESCTWAASLTGIPDNTEFVTIQFNQKLADIPVNQ